MSIATKARNFCKNLRAEGTPYLARTATLHLRARSIRRTVAKETAERAQVMMGYEAWLRAQQPDAAERARQHAAVFTHRLSFLIPTYNTDPAMLAALVDSLLAQTTDAWEACFYDGHSSRPETLAALRALENKDPRLHVVLGDTNQGISGNTNCALQMAQGDWVALVDHDDLVTPDAAYCVLACAEGGAELFYSDEDKCDEAGEHFFDPHLKSDFDPDALRAGNYICHLMAMSRALMVRIGGLRTGFDGSQDHDLALRATEQAARIVHLPRILYHWRQVGASFSHQKAEICAQAAARAVNEQFLRLGLPERAQCEELNVRVDRPGLSGARCTLIVDAAGRDCAGWLRHLLKTSADAPAQVIVARSGPAMAKACARRGWTCLPAETTERAQALNAAAAQAKGDVLVFLHAGVTPETRTWLRELLLFALRPDVGCAGTRIVDRRRCYLHAGYAVDVPEGAVSFHRGLSLFGAPYMLTDRKVRRVSAVAAAEMAVRREVFTAAGGFEDYESDLLSVAFGLKCQALGLCNIFTPHALAVARADIPCLAAPAPEGEKARLQAEFGPHPAECFFSPLLEKRTGHMLPDLTVRELLP